jgi:hypothetical protein
MFERPITRQVAQPVLEQHDAAERGAGHEAGQPGRQPAGIDRMEAVDILVRIDAEQHLLGIEMRGKRQLDQDTVHRGIGIELLDQRQQLGLARVRGQAVLEALHARLARGLALAADIDGGGGVLADQHHRQPGRAARRLAECGNPFGDAGAKPRRICLAVDHCRAHGTDP